MKNDFIKQNINIMPGKGHLNTHFAPVFYKCAFVFIDVVSLAISS